MIQNASRMWGYPDDQDINSFDPIVGMILGALADELTTVSTEIQKTDARVIQKLLDLLFNQNLFTHFPAHGIVQASPVQPYVLVSDSSQFSYRKRIEDSQSRRGKPEERNIHFTASGEFKLFKGQVKIFAGGNQMFLLSGQVKEAIDLSGISQVPELGKLYIGLELDKQIDDLAGLSLHFSLKNIPNEDRFYRSLTTGMWFINEEEVSFSQGLDFALHQEVNGLEELFRQENDISYRACKYVNDFYGHQFMVLEGESMPTERFLRTGTLPSELVQAYSDDIIKLIPANLFWVKIELAQPLSPEMISQLNLSMNCFPIINRGINEFTQSLKKGSNIIPLNSDDIYYDVKQISDSKGTIFELANSVQNAKDQKNIYSLRQGGIARFDSRDALESIDHLTDLVRNESAAFSILGTDMISSELKELDQIITRLKQRLETSSNSSGTSSYVMLNSENNYERVHVEFWSTSGELANNIRSGSRLNVYRGRDINANSVYLLTNTIGGRQKLTEEDKLYKLRRALLSKGRIATREDIKALCFELFGKELQKVEIQNGIKAEDGPKKGLVQTLDIVLILKKQHKLNEEDLKHKVDGLKIMLKQGSINMVLYRVIVR